MTPPRSDFARLALRVAPPSIGAVWAGALVVLGIWALTTLAPAPGAPRSAGTWAGLFLVAAGQFVFMVVVADHIIPPRRPLLAHALEGAAAIVTIVAAIGFALALF